MFEIGKTYRLTMLDYTSGELGQTTHHEAKVVEVNMPLIKVQFPSRTPIVINTASQHFISAREG